MSVGNGWGYPSPLHTSIHKMSSKTAFWPAWQILILTYVLPELSAVTEDRLFSGLHTHRPPSEGFTCSLRYSFEHGASWNIYIYIWNKFDNDLSWNLFLLLKNFSHATKLPSPKRPMQDPQTALKTLTKSKHSTQGEPEPISQPLPVETKQPAPPLTSGCQAQGVINLGS